MTTLKRGMIVDVDLDPTKGSETGKTRPCVIVTNDTITSVFPLFR
jgi:mRNA interferase MazF